MNKIIDIKKVSSTKHVDVDDQTKETAIDVHKEGGAGKNKEVSPDTPKKTTDDKKTLSEENKDKSDSVTKKKNEQPKKTPNSSQKQKDGKKVDLTKMRIIFMGTGVFANAILEEIHKNAPGKLVQIITQPDKKVGRKKTGIYRTLAPNPVRDFAKENDIPLFQPCTCNKETLKVISDAKPGVIVVASYGQILTKKCLDIPRFGPINIHASLLPELRGASPVQNALLQGKKETGVTIMQMDEGIDTGDIIAQKTIPILEHEKADELLKRVAKIGAKLLLEFGPKSVQGEVTPVPQDHSKATLCQLIDREDGHIQWTQTTEEIYNRYRALHPWPGIFGYWAETETQLLRIKLRTIYPYTEEMTDKQKEMLPGTVFIGHDQLCIRTFDSAIIVEAIQPECKAVMPVYDFLNGHKDFEGAVLK
ncbi:MAG: methionyl-tRNA formyltransferase [Patescibacteria group bacterium]|nr:methionyl-tRNA formyltransferase [Patescibacteria group bacterium]